MLEKPDSSFGLQGSFDWNIGAILINLERPWLTDCKNVRQNRRDKELAAMDAGFPFWFDLLQNKNSNCLI